MRKKVDGNYKPRLVSNIRKDRSIETEDGEMVIFHDKMLHGGSKHKKCRISIEFTALIRKGQR